MKEKNRSIVLSILTFFVGVIGTLCVVYFLYMSDSESKPVSNENRNVTVTEADTIKSAIGKVYDAVYVIETYDKNGRGLGSGTGFVYKKDKDHGYVLTNHHVISGATTIKITNTAGGTFEATLLGSDEYTDIAVLSVPLEAVLQVAILGDSSTAELGDTAFTVGSPLGIKYMGSVTKGIISGKNRQVTVSLTNGNFVMDVLQTDAAINPGNSGGPLLNINGEVIGITSMKLVQDEIEGMGFALPIEFVMSYVDQLEKGQQIVRPMLGVQMIDLGNPYTLAYYKITISDDITSGVVIAGVEDGSPASEAGLEKGDVITKINDVAVADSAHLKSQLYKYHVGDTIRLSIIRDGKEREIKVKLSKSLES